MQILLNPCSVYSKLGKCLDFIFWDVISFCLISLM
ncbi:hypothetical protein SLEP1_g57411 [Rubroshorea leprosula]|uniref:Photosystem II protein I n=1 Tax=Rubroshorea leprosula TaxID=152421 RepID=A0AAV5MQQ7_9ROSI|nr:hypothetical protein SLEP1_g57411 [Rubroshorea leprosula]